MITVKYQSKDPNEGWLAQTLPFVPGKRMKYYLKDLRMIALSLRCDVIHELSREKIRLNVVPPDGSSIIMQPAGRGGV